MNNIAKWLLNQLDLKYLIPNFIGLVFFCSFLFGLSTCQKNRLTYLHIAHTRAYDGSSDKLMTAVEEMDFGAYDKLLLGGDLVYKSTERQATLKYLDDIFDLSNPKVLWTLGNHDYQDHPEWIPEVTKRPKVYSYQDRGIAYWVMDSQENNGNTSLAQKEILNNADQLIGMDVSHLIVLHHKLLWLRDNGPLEAKADSIANGGMGACFYCLPPNDFYKEVYPVLVQLQNNGIQVICIAGDIGVYVDQFEYQTQEGIYFLASGLKDGSDSNKLLVLEHHLRNQEITWQFKDL